MPLFSKATFESQFFVCLTGEAGSQLGVRVSELIDATVAFAGTLVLVQICTIAGLPASSQPITQSSEVNQLALGLYPDMSLRIALLCKNMPGHASKGLAISGC